MAIEYKYPRVNISTLAKTRSVRIPERADTTVLFQPIYAKRGPVNKIVRLFAVDELLTTYGEPDFATQGQGILNAINWLKNGGTVYATRLTQPGITTAVADGETLITAKYPGTFYNDIELEFTWNYSSTSLKAYSFTLKIDDYETFKAQTLKELIIRVNDSSDYISIDPSFDISSDILSGVNKTKKYTLKNAIDGVDGLSEFTPEIINNNANYIKFSNGIYIYRHANTGEDKDTNPFVYDIQAPDGSLINDVSAKNLPSLIRDRSTNLTSEQLQQLEQCAAYIINNPETNIIEYAMCPKTNDELVRDLFGTLDAEKSAIETLGPISQLLGNKLETPIDVILDAGYSEDTKTIISLYTKNVDQTLELSRKDIICIFDEYVNDYTTKYTGKRPTICDISSCINKCDNRAVYTQYFLVDDDYAKNIWVTPSYFLAKLIPHNDITYGIQWPTAGLTRGVLTDVKDINENPTPSIKNANFIDRINYVERDSNGYKFMSQRTFDGSEETEYTALSFLNNSRALAKMVKELEKVGREYLFEFNDATTLANMRAALNRYMSNWVSNRTLNFAEVDVAASEYSDEAVDVTLNVRFTGTIEVISIDIIIE